MVDKIDITTNDLQIRFMSPNHLKSSHGHPEMTSAGCHC